jgi:PAS domain S-box-containing protein/putative nucleotidyltransferase with HDIG domain
MLENNIIKRKQAEKALAESEEKFRITLKNSPIVVWNQDKDLRYTWIYNPNPRFKTEETIGKTDKEILSADDAEKLMHIKRKVLESGIGAREETKVTIQGNDYYYDLTVEPLLDSNNAIIGITCVAIDITECKQAEEALRLHVVMMDNVAEGIYLTGMDDLLIKWTNEKFTSMFGYDPGELVGKQVDIVNAFTEKTPTKTRISIVDVLKKTGEWQGEVKNIKRDGTHFWCHANVSLFDHPEYGKVIVSVHTDITERKQAEDTIKIQLAEITNYYNNIPIGLAVLDCDLRFLKINDMLAQINGIPAEEHINKTIKEIVPGLALQALKITAEILHTGEPVKDIEFIGETLADPGLKHVWLEGWYPLKDATGKIIGFTVIVQDITKRKQADEKIKHINIKLKERVKEFNFLFQLSQLFEKTDISLEEIIQKLTGLLPAAWQYPEITCAQIILENKKYMTENFKETIWKQSGNIMINKKIIGSLEVYYSEERPEMDEGPFQKEERNLITIITERLGKFLNRIQSEMQLQQSYQKIKIAMNTTIETMSKIVEAKDPYTAGHQKRVSQLAVAISKELNLPQEQIEGIRIASLIHDVGKISVPTEILSKSIKLSDIEFSLIKEHSQTGYDILKSIDFSYPVAEIVLQHHERLNGSGYPNHLKTDKILMGARIIGVADVVEAMSSNRPYRPALGIDVALEEISKNKGILYDPIVVDTCLVLFKEKGFKFE